MPLTDAERAAHAPWWAKRVEACPNEAEHTYGPAGSQEYSVTGTDPATGAPIYRQDIKLDPQLEQSYRGQLGQNAQLNQGAGNSLINQINGLRTGDEWEELKADPDYRALYKRLSPSKQALVLQAGRRKAESFAPPVMAG